MSLERLLQIMEKLRSPEGCPWDREQTHDSLKRYLIEEAYEVLEAIDTGDPSMLADELGDVLLQVVFHAQIAKEQGTFTMDDVIEAISSKLIRRHPHVFGEIDVSTVSDVIRNWDAIKRAEKQGQERTSLLDGVPKEFPALMRAEKIQQKAAKVGFEWDDVRGALAKAQEEFYELQDAVDSADQDQIKAEFGDLLFALVNVARYVKVDPELALQDATSKFVRRFQFIEEKAKAQGLSLEDMSLAEMDAIWDEAKAYFRKKPQS
ncbi:MAG: nucleoside triphosphate pyrophosphohydrolase [Firmicutes bacterium]|jgi:tetrapyrrole methylase family protein/MazG family protein|nr:nucleoside triphosphate pyrophosphohydrolase [Bacillota bacterium]